jgi:hypothetical protein
VPNFDHQRPPAQNAVYAVLPGLALCAGDGVVVGGDGDGGAGLHRLLDELLSQLSVHPCIQVGIV